MNKQKLTRHLLSIALFFTSFAVIFLLVQRYQAAKQPAPPPAAAAADGNALAGLPRGTVVTLPELPSLSGGTVSLRDLKEPRLLLALFSTSCPGCSRDSSFWRKLQQEATNRHVAFYVIAVDEDQESVMRFAKAYSFDDLPVLIDRAGIVPQTFDVSIVPQYILLTSDGRVVDRWNGLSHTNVDNQRAEQPAQFFLSSAH